jgi:hypothetical protein
MKGNECPEFLISLKMDHADRFLTSVSEKGRKIYPLTTTWGFWLITMIGNEIGELTGKTIGIRLAHHYGGPMKLERTIESKGKIYGTDVTFIATTWAVERQHGGSFVKGHGVMMTKTGEKAEAQGSGISFPTRDGGWTARGVRYFQTGSAALKKLNDVAAVFEIEIGPDGSYKDKMWEWK